MFQPKQVNWCVVPLEDVQPLQSTRFIGPGSMVRVVNGRYTGREGRVVGTPGVFMLEIEEGWL